MRTGEPDIRQKRPQDRLVQKYFILYTSFIFRSSIPLIILFIHFYTTLNKPLTKVIQFQMNEHVMLFLSNNFFVSI